MIRKVTAMNSRETLMKLCMAFGPTGAEDKVSQVIEEMVRPYVDEIRRDAMGNLIAVKRGQGQGKVMVAAHMDQIGLMVTSIDENGFLRVANVGGIAPRSVLYRQVTFGNGTVGCVGLNAKAPSLDKVTLEHVFIDIGCESRAEALEKVQIGDTCIMQANFLDMGQRMSSPAMDNRSACAVLVEALKRLDTPAMDVYGVFTTQEEVGLRGAKTAAFAIQPDVGIAVDITGESSYPEAEATCSMKMGQGAAVKVRDASVFCTPAVVRWMEETAKEEGIPYQREVLTFGGTDTQAIQLTGAGIPAGCISIPGRYIHSMCETIDGRDYEAAIALLAALLKKEYQH